MSNKPKQEKDVSKAFSDDCQVCGKPVTSIYVNSLTGKTGHKNCV